MELIQKMLTPCQVHLVVVRRPDGSFVLREPCPEGAPPETTLEQLREKCGSCIYNGKRVAVIGTDGKLIEGKVPAAYRAEVAAQVAAAPPAAPVAPSPPVAPPMPTVPPPAPMPTIQPAPPPPAPVPAPTPALPDPGSMLPMPGQPMPPAMPQLPAAPLAPVTPPLVSFEPLLPTVPQAADFQPELSEPSTGEAPPEAAPPRAAMPKIDDLLPMPGQVAVEAPAPAPTLAPAPAPAQPAPPAPPVQPQAAPQPQPQVEPGKAPPVKYVIPFLAAMPKGGEADVDVEEVCRKFAADLGLATSGPSWGGISPHMLMDDSCKRRSLLRYGLGIVPVKKPEYLIFGTFYHAVMAMRYTRSDQVKGLIDAVKRAGAPKMAEEVEALYEHQIIRFGQSEADTWCPRAVEHNMLAWTPPIKIGKRGVRIPLATRVDLITGLKDKGEAHPSPQGPYAPGVYCVDWKHSSFMTSDLVSGYGMDFQFNTILSIFTLGQHANLFGKLNGIIVHIVSRKDKIDDDSFFRDRLTFKPPELTEFMSQQLLPAAADFYTRMSDPELRALPKEKRNDVWPQDHRQCKNPFKCPYFDFCDHGMLDSSMVGYKVDEGRIIHVEAWEKPPAGVAVFIPEGLRIAGGVVEEKEEKPAGTAVEKASKAGAPKATDEDQEAARDFLAKSYIDLLAGATAPPDLKKEKHLKPGFSIDKVVKSLGDAFKEVYKKNIADGGEFKIGFYLFSFKKTGFGWNSSGKRGTITWKQIAEAICKLDWYRMENVMPPLAQG